MKRICYSIPIMLFLFLSGCMNIETHILDEIQLSSAAGYDVTEEDQLEVTVVYPIYANEGSIKNKTLTATADLSKEVRDMQNLQSEKPMVSGKIEVALYSKELAAKGISSILDNLTLFQ